MSRYEDDIPEIFRRAMEEAGWEPPKEEPPRRPPNRPAGPPPWWANRWVWVVLLLMLFLASFSWLVTTYTEWLWFQEVGFEQVWLTQFGARLATFAVFFVVAAGFLLLTWLLARRAVLASHLQASPLLHMRASRWLIAVAALFFGYVLASAAAGQSLNFLRYLNQVPFGVEDPIFSRDLSFYLFTLPVLRFLRGWFMPLLLFGLVGMVVIYFLGNVPAVRSRRVELRGLPLALRQAGALILAGMLALWAVGHWLDIYDLLYSSRGVVFGATYTELNSTLLALRVQMVLMALLAVAVAFNVVRLDVRPAVVLGVLWVAATFLLGTVYPGLQQRYVVEPNELALERPYIEHNINFTRLGFGMDNIDSREFSDVRELSADDLAQSDVALRNIRLWDYQPLQQTYSQLQELRPYYEFGEIDIDRYEIDGVTRQVMLAVRELEGLADPTWVNEKLEFTHGYGVVMNPVDEVSREGRPNFYIKDLPPVSTIDLQVTRPEVYYGELMDEIVYVGSALEEFNYPSGDENVYTSYEGTGGVPLSSYLRRLLFAYRFGETNLLFSQYITPETRVMFHRQIRERVNHIAPFLVLDHDPYIVVTDEGRLVWMIDGYTVSRNFPYSQPIEGSIKEIPAGVNYIRNSVKATVNAYHGTVTLYLADTDDPLIQTYAQIFPGMFRPLEEMPADLYRHIRFPEGLFLVQTQQYLVYHVTDVQVFYNREDEWSIPLEIFDNAQRPIEPYYVTFPLPGEETAEYLLIQPYTPIGRNNMIAWLAARNDPPHYGEIVAYELPKQELVFGPIQVEGRIDQDPFISQQFSLWNQQGSRVIRGNLIVIPINNSFLYVEPIYLLSANSALPELRRVIVASGDQIAMRETLALALGDLLGEEVAVPGDTGGEEGPAVGDQTVEELILSAGAHFNAAQQAQRAGDWATYGRELDLLEQVLSQLMELTGAALPEAAPVEPVEPEAGG